MGFLLNLFTGGLGSIVSSVAGMFNKAKDVDLGKYEVDGKVDSNLIAADTERLKAQAMLQAAGQQYSGNRWMQYLFAYPLGFWWICLMFDSTIGKTLGFPTTAFKLPHPADEWSGWIVGYLFLHTTILSVMDKRR